MCMSALILPAPDPVVPESWQMRPFTTETGMSMGLTKRELYGPDFRQVVRGVFVAALVPDTIVVRAHAARLVLPKDAVFSHHTAARLLGGPAPDTSLVHASLGRDHRRDTPHIQLHRYTYEPDAMWRHGLPVTKPVQTFIHLGLKLDMLHVVAFGDAMVRRGMVTVHELRERVQEWSGQGLRNAIAAAAFVRDGVDSPPESHLRLLFVLAGFPEPEVNWIEHDDEGFIRKRIELAYRSTPRANAAGKIHLGFEYDGRKYHSTAEQKIKDEARRLRLADEGWHIEVVTGDELYRNTEMLLLRAYDLLCQFGIAVPRRIRDDWRRHFWAPTWTSSADKPSR